MKRLITFFTCLMILISLNSLLFADEIYLKNNTIIKGKVTRVSPDIIFYHTNDKEEKTTGEVSRKKVAKITYTDGTEVVFNTDTLYLTDNSVIQGKIIQVGTKNIEYNPVGEKPFAVISKDRVSRIKYSDGTVVPVSEELQEPEKEAPFEEDVLPRKGGFLESRVRIAGFASVLLSYGDIEDKEKELYNANISGLNQTAGRNYKTTYNPFHFGGEVDVMLYTSRFIQKKGFDLTGLQFGVKGGYLFYHSYQGIYEYNNSSYASQQSSGTMMQYHSWFAGPMMNFVLSPRNDIFNMIIHCYGVYGRVIDGSITAAAALRDANIGFLPSQYTSDIDTGFYFKAGAGPHFVLNKGFPVTVGFNVIYSYSKMNFKNPISLYDANKKDYSAHEWGFELAFGVHI
ncbi:MAG: hypothetical protein GY754_40285 [bacterium]|nr:hypothetical protein [bacterium]